MQKRQPHTNKEFIYSIRLHTSGTWYFWQYLCTEPKSSHHKNHYRQYNTNTIILWCAAFYIHDLNYNPDQSKQPAMFSLALTEKISVITSSLLLSYLTTLEWTNCQDCTTSLIGDKIRWHWITPQGPCVELDLSTMCPAGPLVATAYSAGHASLNLGLGYFALKSIQHFFSSGLVNE